MGLGLKVSQASDGNALNSNQMYFKNVVLLIISALKVQCLDEELRLTLPRICIRSQ